MLYSVVIRRLDTVTQACTMYKTSDGFSCFWVPFPFPSPFSSSVFDETSFSSPQSSSSHIKLSLIFWLSAFLSSIPAWIYSSTPVKRCAIPVFVLGYFPPLIVCTFNLSFLPIASFFSSPFSTLLLPVLRHSVVIFPSTSFSSLFWSFKSMNVVFSPLQHLFPSHTR